MGGLGQPSCELGEITGSRELSPEEAKEALEAASHPFGVKRCVTENTLRADWSRRRLKLADIVESRPFELFMGMLILLNAVLVIMETDARAVSLPVPRWAIYCMNGLMLAYIVDITVRLYTYRFAFFANSWNMFDLTVVSVDVFIEFLGVFNIEIGISVSVFRLLRLGRLLRFVQVLSIFKELGVMLHLMAAALKAIGWGSILMAVMLTIWSIIATEVLHPLNRTIAQTTNLYDDCERCPRAFESVWQSNITFFQQIIAGDSWGQVSVVLIEHYPSTALLLGSVIISINLGLMNLVITVIVDKAQTSREENVQALLEEREKEYEKAKRKFIRVCGNLDGDCSGDISLGELEYGYDAVPEFSDTLKVMDVKKSDLGVLFRMMDKDSDGTVSYHEFANELYSMKMQDMKTAIAFTKAYVNEIRDLLYSQAPGSPQKFRSRGSSKDGGFSTISRTISGNGRDPGSPKDTTARAKITLQVDRPLRIDTGGTELMESLDGSLRATPSTGFSTQATPSSTWRTSQEKTKITGVQHYFTLERTNETHEAADMGRSPTPQAQHYQRGGTAAGSDSAHGSGSLWTPGHWAVDDSRCLPPRPLRAGTC